MTRNRISEHPFFSSFFILLFVALFTTATFAQRGKISAKIVDAKTGEALLKASIQILETKQGALSKENGVATIINVAPSESYSVVAKYAGYQPQTITNVKVQSDITTSLNFKLSSKAQDTIIISSDRLVELTKTDIGHKVGAAEIQTVAGRQSIDGIIALTPGLVRDGSNGGFSVHGSRGTSNSIKMNGVETADPVDGSTSITQTAVSKFAISEISVTTAGGDASKSGTGGQISSETRRGGLNFEFMFHYRQDLPSLFGKSLNGYKMDGANDKIYELAFGGPITEDVKYFITAKGNTIEHANVGLSVKDPLGNDAGSLPNNHFYSRSVTGKLSFDLLGFHLSADAVLTSSSSQSNNAVFLYSDPVQLPAINSIDNLYTLRGNTGVGATGLVEFSAGYEAVSDRFGKYDQSQGGGLFSLYKIYDAKDEYKYDDNTHTITPGQDGIVDIYTPVSRQIPDPHNPASPLNLSQAGINPFTGHIEGGPIAYSTNNAYGLLNQFIVAGNVSGFSDNTRRHFQFEAKYTDQVGSHLLNGGIEAQLYTLKNYNNGLPWDANPFRDSFIVKPVIAAAYVIDKMEFSDITFNPSLRFDFYNPGNDHSLLDPFNPTKKVYDPSSKDSITVGNFTKAPIQTQLSPRLGITYAVSEKTTFNFNYNLYFKQPLFGEVLTNTGGNFSTALQRGNQIIGNGSLKAEHTQEIAVGFTSAVTDVLVMGIQGIYKDLKNLSGLQRITSPSLALGYQLYSDDQYGNYKGLEFTLEKKMSDNYSLRFNYTYSIAKGTSSSSTENYFALINQSADAEVAVLPLQPFYLSFDRTHVAQLILSGAYGRGEGPKIGGVAFLQMFNLSTTSEYRSGVPYTHLDARGRQSGEFNADRNPSYLQTDATLTRSIPLADIFGSGIGTSSLDIQLEVINLFNRTEALAVYPTSGQGDDDGINAAYTGGTDFINDPTNADAQQLDAFGLLKYNARWDLNKDGRVSVAEQTQAYKLLRAQNFARHTNYQIPRRMYLNFSFHF